ncbi:hypothetical protein [Amycolatopsis sp. NBC_01480]|uniref:hypothetical protein n=1 Tax=Amycolatopsis sp. NBC_01480 TaxID=2903562 RepID=UPI002E2C4A8A|nr:hypothetical protein [Amycolatopsis sp. NBC_01480]
MRAVVELAADAPTAADWLSGWGAVGSGAIALAALVAAVFAVRAANRTNKLQTAQLDRLEQGQRRALAAEFGVWASQRKPYKLEILYNNTGTQPMYRALVQLQVPGLPSVIIPSRSLAPTAGPTVLGDATEAAADLIEGAITERLGPQTSKFDEFGDEIEDLNVHETRQKFMFELDVSTRFQDANGISWERRADGRLYETGTTVDVEATLQAQATFTATAEVVKHSTRRLPLILRKLFH